MRQTSKKVVLSQMTYIEEVLKRLGMQLSLATYLKFSVALSPQTREDVEQMSHVPYLSDVSCVMYDIVYT